MSDEKISATKGDDITPPSYGGSIGEHQLISPNEGKPTLQDYILHAEASRASERHGGQSETYVFFCFCLSDFHPTTTSEKDRYESYDEELAIANRVLRTAGWMSVFYLITTDILGPFNAPFAFSQVGYVPGAILYVVSKYPLFFCHLSLIIVVIIVQWVESHATPVSSSGISSANSIPSNTPSKLTRTSLTESSEEPSST